MKKSPTTAAVGQQNPGSTTRVKQKRALKLLVAMAVAVCAIFAVTGAGTPAEAGGRTFLWNSRGGAVPMFYAPRPTNVMVWSGNNTTFRMSCWTDFVGYTGNYYSTRWFYGQTYATGSWGYIHSSYVYNQTGVRHC